VNDGSVLVLFARLLVSLGVVLGLMWALGRVLRARGLGGSIVKPGSQIEVVARQSVGRNSSIAVVRAAGKALIVSITENQVSLLAEADPAVLARPEAQWTAPSGIAVHPRASSPRKTLLEQARELTVRR
jgi:flagellar biogenesis protein FliO